MKGAAGRDSVAELTAGLLDEVRRLYPVDRVARAMRRTEAMWDGAEPDGSTAWVLPAPGPAEPPAWPPGATDWDKDLLGQLRALLDGAAWADDKIPGLAPGIRQVLLPSYFGCDEESLPGSLRVRPIIRAPSDVSSLPEVGFGPGTPGGRMLDKIRFFKEATGGSLAIYEPDLQGPFSVASQVWGVEGFLLAISEHPREAMDLVERCTAVLLRFVAEVKAAAGELLVPYHCPPALWYPARRGIAYSEDLMAVVSPEVVRDFVLPSVEKIAAELGGVVLHSCGRINHLAGTLSGVPGLVGLNFSSSETDLPLLLAAVSPRLACVVHNSPVASRGLPVLGPLEHARLCARSFGEAGVRGLCAILHGTAGCDPSVLGPQLEEVLGRGNARRDA